MQQVKLGVIVALLDLKGHETLEPKSQDLGSMPLFFMQYSNITGMAKCRNPSGILPVWTHLKLESKKIILTRTIKKRSNGP